MRHLYPSLTAALLALFFLPSHVIASEDGEKRVQVTELRAQARQLRAGAGYSFDEASRRCAGKFSQACMEKAWAERKLAETAAKRLEKQALNLENEIKAEKRAAKRMQREERAKLRGTPEARRQTKARIKQEKQAVRRAKEERGGVGPDAVSVRQGVE